MEYDVVTIGCSAGGLNALKLILPHLPEGYALTVILVSHRHVESDGVLEKVIEGLTHLQVKQVHDKESIESGTIYVAPPNYHLLIEEDLTFSLSADEPVQFSRPSINVCFESVAYAFGRRCVGVILTGGNDDGSRGLKLLKEAGGLSVVQSPESAEVDIMPRAAIAACAPDYVLSLNEIGPFLKKLGARQKADDET